MEAIDNQVTTAVLKTERQVSIKAHGYAWSPKLAEAGQRVTFWRNCLRMVKDGVDPGKVLIPSQVKGAEKLRQGFCKKYYQARLEDAWDSLHFIQQEAANTRQAFLEDSLEKATSNKGSTEHI